MSFHLNSNPEPEFFTKTQQEIKEVQMMNNQPDGYLALPSHGEGSPVLVLHAWWGLNDMIRTLCDRLAQSGFTAFAPDLYHGSLTDSIAEAEALSASLFSDLDQARAEATNAATFLIERSGQADKGLAVIGFSLGAFFALDLSVTAPGYIRSVVVFYGTRPGDYTDSKAAYLGHFAETDQFEPRSEVDGLEESLKRAGRPVTFYHYSGTGHWFFEPNREHAYKQAAAGLAWDRTLLFLKRTST
jgi:carboxymethylenebutenolidase